LDRLIQALRRKYGVDKAIDLGIALEVMLLHGIGKNDRGELRFRSSIRGATFLGGEKKERLEILRLLKEAYDLRSQAVHSGVLKKGKSQHILEQAAKIGAKIALNLIERRSFPDWDAEIVIGGQ
jgi:Apea-like HEPN